MSSQNCTGITKKGTQCLKKPIKGEQMCSIHKLKTIAPVESVLPEKNDANQQKNNNTDSISKKQKNEEIIVPCLDQQNDEKKSTAKVPMQNALAECGYNIALLAERWELWWTPRHLFELDMQAAIDYGMCNVAYISISDLYNMNMYSYTYVKFVNELLRTHNTVAMNSPYHKLTKSYFDERAYPPNSIKIGFPIEEHSDVIEYQTINRSGGFTLGQLLFEMAKILPKWVETSDSVLNSISPLNLKDESYFITLAEGDCWM